MMGRVNICWVTFALTVFVCSADSGAAQPTYPGKDWQTATPQSQKMDGGHLDAAAAYAQKYGGGSGCVIRDGYLVKEWGDPKKLADIKSCTKGTVGTTLLGVAVEAGLVELDDLAQKHYPRIGQEKPENVQTDWLETITIRQLATMTAGFDDGRPPKLVYRPGTKGIYSNDTSNMLAELLTLKFKEDLSPVFKRQVMDVIGAPEGEWKWRANSFRAKTIDGLTSREFASGITITHRTLARIGYLYLREGMWDGKRVISSEFVRMATRPTELPGPFPYYAFCWASNQRGQYAGMPKDTCWALGLGDSFVVYSPSLDIVAVRLGVGSTKSHLPGGEDDWGARVEGFFKIVVAAVEDRTGATTPTAATTRASGTSAPYPPSQVIRSITWAPKETIVRRAEGSDNWPMTWGDDDAQYTAYGDGNGFDPKLKEKLSLGFAKITGGPESFTAVNLRSATGEQRGDGKAGRKASGLLMVDGVLYMWLRNAENAQLRWSADHARTWSFADWKFTQSFGCPTFLSFGRNYAGARDDYVYVYSHDSDSAYEPADRMVMARVPKDRIREREAYEFFQQIDRLGQPMWTKDIAQRGAVFTNPGRCYRSGISYDAGLRRYLWCQIIPGGDTRFTGGIGIYDAPQPWGPWTTAFYTESWDVGPGESASFPAKWMSADGKSAHLVFSGDDAFSVRKAALDVAPPKVQFINTGFDNASPLQWEMGDDGAVNVFMLYDYERNSPNRAAGHWFFELQAEPGTDLTLVLYNFNNVWNGRPGAAVSKKSVCFISTDRKNWKVIPAEFLEGARLRIAVHMDGPSLFLARIPPYGLADLQRLLDEIRGNRLVEISQIGKTVEGRPLEIIRVGNPDAPYRVLLRARSHAWEPGGNWVAEGLIRSLLKDDQASRRCMQRYCVYVMPMANKDGVARGRTRFNMLGKDLNRDWDKPADPKLAPENHALEMWVKGMIDGGKPIHFAMDLHNDEGGGLHISRPPVKDLERHLARMKLLEQLLRQHTWFTEGSSGESFRNTGTIGEGLLERYGIDACVLEFNCNWIAGLKQPPSAAAWEQFGAGLREAFLEYFQNRGRD